jgi:glucuronyl/N-acetylglucosaminyl transferase EXT1
MKIKLKLLFILLSVFFFTKFFIFLNQESSYIELKHEIIDFKLSKPNISNDYYDRKNDKYPKGYETCKINDRCFNRKKCQSDFKVYIYQEPNILHAKIFESICNSIRLSNYYTDNPNEACLFLSSIDTIDRDRLSKNYVKNIDKYIEKLEYWNNGKNHLIFNLYSGTWPNYLDNLNFNFGKAIILQASLSFKYYRQDYDVSFPLFHSTIGSEMNEKKRIFEIGQKYVYKKEKYFLTFKGKRYLSGIGSDARNALYHLNNDRDIYLLTTCNHTSNTYVTNEEDRCLKDDFLYKK